MPQPTTTYQNLPNLTTPSPSDQIANSPEQPPTPPDPARRPATPAQNLRHTRARRSATPAQKELRHTRACRGYLAEHSTQACFRLPHPTPPLRIPLRHSAPHSVTPHPTPSLRTHLRHPLRPLRHSCAGRNPGDLCCQCAPQHPDGPPKPLPRRRRTVGAELRRAHCVDSCLRRNDGLVQDSARYPRQARV